MAALEMSLRIYGGGLSVGFDASPLVSVGTIPIGYVPMPPIIVDEELSWMISHTQSHTIYALYSRDCETTKGEAGQLLVCLFLPPQKRLANNASPLGLLNTISDIVSIQVLQGGRLPALSVDPSPFIALLKRYPLEERPLPLPVMGGRDSASFCVDNLTQLDALMRHSRYSILVFVGRLELGMHCPSTIKLSTTSSTTNRTVPKDLPSVESASSGESTEVTSDFSDLNSDRGWTFGKKLTAAAVLCVLIIAGVICFNIGNWGNRPAMTEEKIAEDVLVPDSLRLIQEENPKQPPFDIEKARQEILALVNKKDLAACRNHPGWSSLQADEKAAVEAVLNLNRYKGPLRKKVEILIKDQMPFKSMSEIRIVQKRIWTYNMEELN